MSIASEITRIAGLRDTIRTKLIDFGIVTDSSAKLSACSEAIEGIDEATLTVPSLSIMSNPTIDNSTGLVSVSGNASETVSASEGYSKGLSQSISVPVSGNLQLATQAAQTITPGTSNKTIAANRWLTGAQTIKGDSNLVAANIKSGTSIFGVSGSLTSLISTEMTILGSNCYKEKTGSETSSGNPYYRSYAPVTLTNMTPRYISVYSVDSDGGYSYNRAQGTVICNDSTLILGVYGSVKEMSRSSYFWKSGNTYYVQLNESISTFTKYDTFHVYAIGTAK